MLWETSQQLTNLPPLSPESRRVLAEFLNVDQDVTELANELSEDFFDVVQRLCDPALKAWITAINALKNNERRERALHALDITLTSERNPNLIRRAATRILRHLELTKSVARPRAIEVCGVPQTSMQATPSHSPTTTSAIVDVGDITTDQRESHTSAKSKQTTRDIETNLTHPQPPKQISTRTTPDLSKSPSECPGPTNQLSPASNKPLPFSVSSVVNLNTNVSPPQQLTSHPRAAQTLPNSLTTPYPHPAQDSPNFPPNRPLSGCSCAPNSSNPRSFSPTPPFPPESPLCESSFSAILGVHPSAVCKHLQGNGV